MSAGGLLTWHPVTAQALVGIVIMMSYLTALVGAQLLPEPDSRERQIFLALEWFSKSPAAPVFVQFASARGPRVMGSTDMYAYPYGERVLCMLESSKNNHRYRRANTRIYRFFTMFFLAELVLNMFGHW